MRKHMKPKWQHTCKKCAFLGSMFMNDGVTDWYLCNGDDPSVVARYGHKAPEYWSYMPSMVTNDKYLVAKGVDDSHGFSSMQILAQFMLKQGESK